MNAVGDPDALAAEYVLGTLDSGECELARGLLSADEAFAAKVKAWERRLGELHLMVEPVEPDAKVWERIKVKLPDMQQVPPAKPAEPEAPAAVPVPEVEVPSPAIAPAASPEPVPAAAPETLPPPEVKAAGEPDSSPPAAEAAPPLPVLPAPAAGAAPALPVAPAAVSKPAPPPAVTRAAPVAPEHAVAVIGRRLTRWRVFGVLMTLVVLGVAGLVAAWRFAPEHVPPTLQPVELLRLVGVSLPAGPAGSAPRPPAPPESRFDE